MAQKKNAQHDTKRKYFQSKREAVSKQTVVVWSHLHKIEPFLGMCLLIQNTKTFTACSFKIRNKSRCGAFILERSEGRDDPQPHTRRQGPVGHAHS